MGDLIHFSPRADLTASENLREFIRTCKEDLTAFGADLNWDSWKWEGVVYFTKLGVKPRSAKDSDRLDDSVMEFAKAYFRFQQGNNPTGTKNESKALRTIEAALLQVKQTADINGLDMSVLDEAVSIGKRYYSSMAAYHCGREIERLARFVTAKCLIPSAVGTWKSPIKKPRDVNIQTGPEAKAIQEKKLPSQAAFDALAEVFSNDPHNPKDIFTTCAFALTMCASSRGTEVLELPADLEWEEPDESGVMRYGWRYYSGKGYGSEVKWLQAEMVPAAKLAVSRILALGKEARALAVWIEENPTRFYRHPNCPDVADDQPLSAEQVKASLGLKGHLQSSGFSAAFGKHTLNSLWERVRTQQPDGFPWINKERKIKYSNALFCMTRNMLSGQKGTSPVILWAPGINVFNNDLGPRESLNNPDAHQSIFDRWGYKGPDGKRLKLTSHQARHLLSTLGERGGLSPEDLAKWAGRKDQKQNRTYNHMNEFETLLSGYKSNRFNWLQISPKLFSHPIS
jgi:hypothetical protein